MNPGIFMEYTGAFEDLTLITEPLISTELIYRGISGVEKWGAGTIWLWLGLVTQHSVTVAQVAVIWVI